MTPGVSSPANLTIPTPLSPNSIPGTSPPNKSKISKKQPGEDKDNKISKVAKDGKVTKTDKTAKTGQATKTDNTTKAITTTNSKSKDLHESSAPEKPTPLNPHASPGLDLDLSRVDLASYANINIGSGYYYEYDGTNAKYPPPDQLRFFAPEDDGDFRGEGATALLQQADIVISNPPFSLFREYISKVITADKQFLMIANVNAITYKEIFQLIQDNQL